MATHQVDGDHLRDQVWIDIRTILMEHWDPIGVRGEPSAADEYDGYIPGIRALLRARASVESLIDYLEWASHERMGFTRQRERARPAACLLLALTGKFTIPA